VVRNGQHRSGPSSHRRAWLADFAPLVGAEAIERITELAEPLSGLQVQHINSTKHGGGVAEILRSLVPMLGGLGIRADWHTLEAPVAFYEITKHIHNMLQGESGTLSDTDWRYYEDVVVGNAHLVDRRADVVVVHDPQPVALVNGRDHGRRWLWRCHLDLSNTNAAVWKLIEPYVNNYDHIVFSLAEYAQPLDPPAAFVMPAIDPFTIKNRPISEERARACFDRYGIPSSRPIVAQISRFDPWKDPMGVLQAARIAQRDVDFTLVLLGNMANDDPEGARIYAGLVGSQDERTIVLDKGDDPELVNALQSWADVIVQKSTREGFGLTVTEAMWKGRPIVAGRVGGIVHQITDGEDGFLVNSIEETAARIVELLKDPALAQRLGHEARETVRRHFLITTLLERELELLR
jgi:trehalose synthase